MTASDNLDEIIKAKNSILFRGIIILYAVSIFARYSDSFEYYHYISIILYCALFLFFRKKLRCFRLLRLFNDFVFITFILFQTGTHNGHLAIFILLPLLNALNHTHHSIRRAFSVQLYGFTIASFFISNHLVIDFYLLIPIASITIINLLTASRLFFHKVNNSLDTVIENFYLKSETVFKSYKVLREVIGAINTNRFLRRFIKIKRISFFKLKSSNNPYLTISSDFIHTYKLENLDDVKNKSYISKVKGIINRTEIHNGVGIKLHRNSSSDNAYLVLIEFENEVFSLILIILLDKIFIPVFTRILNINHFELEIQNTRKEYVEKTKNELDNIDSAANAVHFLANKLTPITNYFKMLSDLNSGQIPDALKDEWKVLIQNDFERANKNINHIQTKMLKIAQYTNNPNIISDFESIKIKALVTYIRKTFLDACFCSAEVYLNMQDELLNKYIKVNALALDFVFIEFIDNFNKYSASEINIYFEIKENDTLLEVKLVNKIKDFKSKVSAITEYISDFNTGQVNELLQRKGNKGIKFVKQFLQQLNVQHYCRVEEDQLLIFLKFKLL
jgi:hypothetical protein